MRQGALILAGGQSRRMGTNKATLQLKGQTFLSRIVATLQPAAIPIWIVLGHESPPPRNLTGSFEILRDEVANLGPLEGLRCGLKAAGDRADWLFVTSCDVPLLQWTFVESLFALCQPDDDAVVPCHDEQLQPLCAVYHARVLGQIELLLSKQQSSLRQLLQAIRTHTVPTQELRQADPVLDSLRNVNSPADYTRLLAESIRRAAPLSSAKDTG